MKILVTAFAVSLFAIGSFAQCTSCTMTITGNDPADHSVGIGQVLCVQQTGTLTGHIYVSSGGRLCNHGHINSHNIYITGGGEWENDGIANVDTFYMSDPSAVFNNTGTFTNNIMGAGKNSTINNSGSMLTNSYWDTATTFTNSGTFIDSGDIYIGTTSSFTNSGNLTVHQNMYMGMNNLIINQGEFTVDTDLYTDTTTQFINERHLMVGRDFYNSRGCNFTTHCVVTVARDWYNSGIIKGPAAGCAGFSITGQTYNSGIVGDTGHIDICDAGHPAVGVDGNSGTMTGVTYCQCTDSCAAIVISGVTQVNEVLFSVYPNPASDRLQVRFSGDGETVIIMQNMLGETVCKWIMPSGNMDTSLDIVSLPNGSYILTAENKGVRTSRKIEVVR